MDPLLEVSPEDANDVASRVNDSIKRLGSHIKTFRTAHESYVQVDKEQATGEEEDLDITLRKCNTYLKESEG